MHYRHNLRGRLAACRTGHTKEEAAEIFKVVDTVGAASSLAWKWRALLAHCMCPRGNPLCNGVVCNRWRS